MDIDRIIGLEPRPPIVEDLAEIGPGILAVALTGNTRLPAAIPDLGHLRELWALGMSPERLAAVIERCDPVILHIEGTQVADLRFLSRLRKLRALAIDWNTKVEALDFLWSLTRLEVLSLVDLRRVGVLGPLASLTRLRALQLAGGTWSAMTVESLAPLAALEALEDLRLISLRVRDGSLAPLAALRRLRTLNVSVPAPTQEFARLSVRLPQTACAMFHPYVRLDGVVMPNGADPVAALDELGDETVLVTGKGKPFLRAQSDRARLVRYCARFEGFRAAARRELEEGFATGEGGAPSRERGHTISADRLGLFG